MNPQMKRGMGLAKKGLNVVKGGQAALRWGRRLKQLPPLRKKAAAKAAVKAFKKEEKQMRRSERKSSRRIQRQAFRRNAKAFSRVLSAMRKHYF